MHRSRMVIAEFTVPLCLAGLGSDGLIACAVRIWGEGRAPVIGSHRRRPVTCWVALHVELAGRIIVRDRNVVTGLEIRFVAGTSVDALVEHRPLVADDERCAGNGPGAAGRYPRYDTSAGTDCRRRGGPGIVPRRRGCIGFSWWTGPVLVDGPADPAVARADFQWSCKLVLQSAAGAVPVVAAAPPANFTLRIV